MIAALFAGITALFAAVFIVACCQVSSREEARVEYHDSDTAGYQEEQPADMPER